jgi:hypothetical protein
VDAREDEDIHFAVDFKTRTTMIGVRMNVDEVEATLNTHICGSMMTVRTMVAKPLITGDGFAQVTRRSGLTAAFNAGTRSSRAWEASIPDRHSGDNRHRRAYT